MVSLSFWQRRKRKAGRLPGLTESFCRTLWLVINEWNPYSPLLCRAAQSKLGAVMRVQHPRVWGSVDPRCESAEVRGLLLQTLPPDVDVGCCRGSPSVLLLMLLLPLTIPHCCSIPPASWWPEMDQVHHQNFSRLPSMSRLGCTCLVQAWEGRERFFSPLVQRPSHEHFPR